jgi:thiamine-phosphate pyrophosphorylase
VPLDPQPFPVMCLTQDGAGTPHRDQAGRLCGAGARWIQLRMKDAPRGAWLAEAAAASIECRRHGALLVVNDSVDVALESGADGAHLGRLDGDWREARLRLGERRILGGTVNTPEEARRAVASECLDYVGVGPLRFTGTKKNLSPVLGLEGVRRLLVELRGLPAWVIGGVVPGDVPGLRRAGAAGVAVSSFLFRDGDIGASLSALLEAWALAGEPLRQPAPLS